MPKKAYTTKFQSVTQKSGKVCQVTTVFRKDKSLMTGREILKINAKHHKKVERSKDDLKVVIRIFTKERGYTFNVDNDGEIRLFELDYKGCPNEVDIKQALDGQYTRLDFFVTKK